MLNNRSSRQLLCLAAIVIAAGLAYANSFTAPFVFDDLRDIVDNPNVRSLSWLLDPDSYVAGRWKTFESGQSFAVLVMSRAVGYATFSLDYLVWGLEPAGFHGTNLAIHLVATLLLFVIARQLYRQVGGGSGSTIAPCLAAALFALHPVQTQAVTYINQRFASLATLFYLAAFVLYVASQRPGRRTSRIAMYAGAVVAALLAFKTKETAVTLPLMLGLYDGLFLDGSLRQRALRLAPFCAAALVIPYAHFQWSGDLAADLDIASRGASTDRSTHLLSQGAALATYLRLLVLPVNQCLDYGPLDPFSSGAMPSVLAGGVLAATLLVGMIALLQPSRRGTRAGIAGLGLLWFTVALLPESLVPTKEWMNEHRLYLPSVGIAIALAAGCDALAARLRGQSRYLLAAVIVLCLAGLGTATHLRNRVWQSELALWEDVVAKAPESLRGHINYGAALFARQRHREALAQFEEGLRLSPRSPVLMNNAAAILILMQDYARALPYLQQAVMIDTAYIDAYNNIAVVGIETDDRELAQRALQKALSIDPASARATELSRRLAAGAPRR